MPSGPDGRPGSSQELSPAISIRETGDRPGWSPETVLRDYRIGYRSRQCSIVGRKEVFSGKAKFGIFGEGKECAQLAMAHAFEKGDFRCGYYRDQTLMFALDLLTPEQLFAQMYAHPDVAAEPATGGRAMTSHFATRLLDDNGRFLRQLDRYNSTADLSPTASQLPRLVGLAYASTLYRRLPELEMHAGMFSSNGDEITFGTIGEASCAEGLFWESVNALGVLQAPALISIWDDGFGISVPNVFQMTKGDIGVILGGFGRQPTGRPGIALHVVQGWDYPALYAIYRDAAHEARRSHAPAIVHVTELTQPYGHSTSGNHERYKSAERLAWEQEYDCLPRMRAWILDQSFASDGELDQIEAEEKDLALRARDRAWADYRRPIEAERREVLSLLAAVAERSSRAEHIRSIAMNLERVQAPMRRHVMSAVTEVLLIERASAEDTRALRQWKQAQSEINARRYGSHLYSESAESALLVPAVPARYAQNPPMPTGFEVMQACFDAALQRVPQLIAIGEDVGRLGGVNQGWAHLQQKYGAHRITDTGIREATIIGQAIGMAIRGLRPIAEIQYLDYLLYALQIISDDLATLRWRTRGGQKAPVIISTRGHRLEGIWHSGSPMSGIVNLVRGLYVCVPRDAVQAAGFYNTMLQSDDAAIIVEVLNGYRKRLPLPENIGEFRLPLGIPEVIRSGTDVTVVTYGACCDIAIEAASMLQDAGIDIEIIDVRTLLPFDVDSSIRNSLRKTSRVLFLDEDCPGGMTAYMMQDVLERQGAFDLLDAPPRTLAAAAHRPAYGSDGDYFSKPNREQIVEAVYQIMADSDPDRFPPSALT